MYKIDQFDPISLTAGSDLLKLQSLEVYATVVGFTSETTAILAFKNDTGRTLEGELTFPLPSSAVVSGFGFEISGRMVDAVVVEKEIARKTFETEVRSHGTAALVEHVKGNSFKTRVYPINPNSIVRVKVQFLCDLDIQNKEASYAIPLKLDKPLAEFSIQIEAQQIVTKPQIKFGQPLKIQSIEGGFLIEEKMKDVQLNEYLVMMVPDFPPNLIMEGEDSRDHVHYFVVTEVPEIPEKKVDKKSDSAKIGIVWDASLSREKVSHEKEFELVEKLLSQVSADVDIFLLRHFTSQPVHFGASDSRSKVLEYLKAITYDGGTNIQSLDLGKTNFDFVLMFTDGLSNVGDDLPTQLPACPMFVFSNSVQINDLPLKYGASKTGGQFFDLLKVANIDKIVTTITVNTSFIEKSQ